MTRYVLPILFAALLPACATKVSENGKAVFVTYANATEIEFRSAGGSYLHMRGVDHSTPTRAGGSVLGTGLSGVAGIAATMATKGMIR